MCISGGRHGFSTKEGFSYVSVTGSGQVGSLLARRWGRTWSSFVVICLRGRSFSFRLFRWWPGALPLQFEAKQGTEMVLRRKYGTRKYRSVRLWNDKKSAILPVDKPWLKRPISENRPGETRLGCWPDARKITWIRGEIGLLNVLSVFSISALISEATAE